MSLKPEQVKKIADLARLPVDENLAQDLSDILDLAAKLNQVATEGIAPMAHPLDAIQPLRTDSVTEENQRDAYLALAPKAAAGFYLVNNVIE